MGQDAILLNKHLDNPIGSAIKLEHMGAFFQDGDKNWSFFFYGDIVYYIPVDDNRIFDSMDKVNEWLLDQQIYNAFKDETFNMNPQKPYISSVYIKGDFTASHKGALNHVERYNQEWPKVKSGELPTGTAGVPNS